MSGDQSRLTKAGAEKLLGALDTGMLFASFVDAARTVLRLGPTHTDSSVLERAAETAGWNPELLRAVRSKEADALASVAIDLCELRVFRAERRSVDEQH